MVKSGKLDGMIKGILGADRKKWPKYRKDGTRIKPMVYEEDPEWVLKSIVYFCKNYTIDGKDLQSKTKGAIETYLGSRLGNIDQAMTWNMTPQGETFWGDLHFLSEGHRQLGDYGKEKPWTTAEKRAIAKMPKVKR